MHSLRVAAVFLVLVVSPALAQDKLPGGIVNRLKDVGTQLARAEKALDQKDAKAAQRPLDAAQKGMDDIFKLYEGKFQADHPDIVAAQTRIQTARKRLEDTLAGATEPGEVKPPAAGPKLPSQVTKRLNDATALLDRAENGIAEGSRSCESLFEKVRNVLDEIEQNYGSEVDMQHPDIAAVRDRCMALATAYDEKRSGEAGTAADAEARRTGQAAEWVAKFEPFVDLANPLNLIADDAPLVVFEGARKLMDEYRATEFPDGKTGELEEVASKVERVIAGYPERAKQRADSIISEAESRLALEEDNWLRWSERWAKDDPTKLPPEMTPDQRSLIEEVVGKAVEAAPEDPRIAALKTRMEALWKEDAARAEKNLSSKRMDADQYAGDDAQTLREFAAGVVAKAFPSAKVLRTTLPSKEWKEESVIEWTDSTQSALRHRVTRSLRAEVAVQEGDSAFVHGVYVGQDRTSDGTWGAPQGHTTWKNRILPENVEK